jgi:hypothetical protein
MANVKISQLPSATTPLSGTEEVPIVQGGATVKTTVYDIGTKANPTTYFMPVNNNGVFIDSALQYEWGTGIISVFNNFFSVQSGLNLNLSQKSYSLGDLFNNISGTTLLVDDTNFIINTKWGGNNTGLYLNFNTQVFALGDYAYTANGGFISFDNNVGKFISYWQNLEVGIKLDFSNEVYQLGDFNGDTTGVYFNINAGARDITSYNSGNRTGLLLDYNANHFFIGDFDGLVNNTFLQVDDQNTNINFYTVNGSYNFANVSAYTDNAAALAAGLVVGDLYRNSANDAINIVH